MEIVSGLEKDPNHPDDPAAESPVVEVADRQPDSESGSVTVGSQEEASTVVAAEKGAEGHEEGGGGEEAVPTGNQHNSTATGEEEVAQQVQPEQLADGSMNPKRPLPRWVRDMVRAGFEMKNEPTVESLPAEEQLEPESRESFGGTSTFILEVHAFTASWFTLPQAAKQIDTQMEVWLKLQQYGSTQTIGSTHRFTFRAQSLNLERAEAWKRNPPYNLTGITNGHAVSLHECSAELWDVLKDQTRSDSEKWAEAAALKMMKQRPKGGWGIDPARCKRTPEMELNQMIPRPRRIVQEGGGGDEPPRGGKTLEERKRELLPTWRFVDMPWAKKAKPSGEEVDRDVAPEASLADAGEVKSEEERPRMEPAESETQDQVEDGQEMVFEESPMQSQASLSQEY